MVSCTRWRTRGWRDFEFYFASGLYKLFSYPGATGARFFGYLPRYDYKIRLVPNLYKSLLGLCRLFQQD